MVTVAVEVDRIVVAVVGLGGSVLARRSEPHEASAFGPEVAVSAIVRVVRAVLAMAPEAVCLGVGVSVPGAVRAGDGLVRSAPNLGWEDVPLGSALGEALGVRVDVGNEADLGALAEHVRGAAVDVDDLAYLSGGVGVGGGFLVDGAALRGADGYAGEVGHLPLDPDGLRCRCGAVGCWETKVGERHVLRAAGRSPDGGAAALAETFAAAAAGDTRAGDAVADLAHWTGVGIRAVVGVLNPRAVVVGGTLAAAWESRPDLVRAGLGSRSMVPPRDDVDVRVADLGDDAALIGAAELAFAPLLDDPAATASPLMRPDDVRRSR